MGGKAGGIKRKEKLAKLSGTSESTIAQAKAVLKNGAKPIQEAVQSGKISLRRGAKISRLDLEKQVRALTEPPEPRPSILDGNEPSEEEPQMWCKVQAKGWILCEPVHEER